MLMQKISQLKSPEFKLAKKICEKLSSQGHIAYLAGGAVRDILLDREPHDYDVATSAEPRLVQALFPKTLDVGKVFGVIVVVEDGISVEVTSFRADGKYVNGRQPEGVVFSDPRTDAQRRDFTMNGLFLDLKQFELIDYVGGERDIRLCNIRAIGVSKDRFHEDHLRILRAFRFQAQLGFDIDEETFSAISDCRELCFKVSGERIYSEMSRLIMGPFAEYALTQMSLLFLFENLIEVKSQISWNYYRNFKIQTVEQAWIAFFLSLLQVRSNLDRLDIILKNWKFPKKTKNTVVQGLQLFKNYETLLQKSPGELVEMSFDQDIFFCLKNISEMNISPQWSRRWQSLEKNPYLGSKVAPPKLVSAQDFKGQLKGRALGAALESCYRWQLEFHDLSKEKVLEMWREAKK